MKCIACGDLFYPVLFGPRMLCPGCHKSAGERKADGRWLGGRKAWATSTGDEK